MHKEFLMGNAAIALGAVAAGVNVVAGYPGTPSTEVLETVAKYRPDDVYVEWSVNEKAAMELAAGAAFRSGGQYHPQSAVRLLYHPRLSAGLPVLHPLRASL